MNAPRGILPVFALAIAVSASASPGLITTTTSTFANIPSFSDGTSSTVTAAQFNPTAIDAAITAGCPPGDTCSAATLIGIVETLTANLTGSITVNNVSGSTKYIAAIQSTNPNYEGTFGSSTSGVALTQAVDVSLDDPYQLDALDAIPVQLVATTNQFRGAGVGTGTSANCTGTASSIRWINCLAIANGGNKIFTGSANGTGGKTYASTDGDWTNEQTPFIGGGAVSFTLNAANGILSNGTSSNLTFPALSGSITALTNGLEIDYTYTYSESASGVPEPMAIFLVGSGLLGLAFARKRARR